MNDESITLGQRGRIAIWTAASRPQGELSQGECRLWQRWLESNPQRGSKEIELKKIWCEEINTSLFDFNFVSLCLCG